MAQRAEQNENMEYFVEAEAVFAHRFFCDIEHRTNAVTYSAERHQIETARLHSGKRAPIKNHCPAHEEIYRGVEPAGSIQPAELNDYADNGAAPDNGEEFYRVTPLHAVDDYGGVAARDKHIYNGMVELSQPQQNGIAAAIKVIEGAGSIEHHQ